MRNKRLLRTLSALCLTLVLASGFTVPAFAQGAAPPPAEDTTNDSNVVVEETEKAPPLTPDGNAALVDDFGGNKQLITVTTKAGNYFYILIDRANEDKKTAVHFLNQVDEADLMALMEDGKPKVCPHCNKEFIPTSNRQVFCSKECCYQARQDKKKTDREAERGNHYYRQRVCAVCGNSYWPTHSQQKFCSEECQRVNHNKKTLEFYHHKKEKEKLQCKDLSQTKERVSDMNLSGTITTPA